MQRPKEIKNEYFYVTCNYSIKLDGLMGVPISTLMGGLPLDNPKSTNNPTIYRFLLGALLYKDMNLSETLRFRRVENTSAIYAKVVSDNSVYWQPLGERRIRETCDVGPGTVQIVCSLSWTKVSEKAFSSSSNKVDMTKTPGLLLHPQFDIRKHQRKSYHLSLLK